MINYEQFLEARVSRRIKAIDRALSRLEKREAAAEKMIGTLVRYGREVHYVFPMGGKYREGSFSDLRAFLVRNNYV